MLAEKDVQDLHDYRVYNDIQSYFLELDQSTKESTIKQYRGTIDEFFGILFPNIDIKFIKVENINNLNRKDILKYREILRNKNSNNTINKKVNTIEKLFETVFIGEDYKKLNENKIFSFRRLPDDSESYDSVSFEESERLAELVYQTEKHNPRMKSLLIKVAVRTSFRFGELTKLTWDDFEDQGDYVLVHVDKNNEKRNKHKIMPISKELYNKVLELKDEVVLRWNGNSNIVFKLKENVDMMTRLNNAADFLGEREIKFHSFRGAAGDWEYEDSKDMKRVMQQLNHSNMNTSYNHYMNKDKDYLSMAGIRMDQEINMDFIDELTIEDFKNFFKSTSTKVKSELKKFHESKKSV